MKQIRDQTNVRVDIPRKDTLTPGNGHANGTTLSGQATPVPNDEDEEPTVPITLSGPRPMVLEAKDFLNSIISRTAKTTQRVRDIPVNVFPFVIACRAKFLTAAEGSEVYLSPNEADREITVSGEPEAVVRVIEAVKGTVEEFKTCITSLKISLPKRQHRLLTDEAVDEIMSKSNCLVVVSSPDDSNDELTVWGKAEHLPAGLQAVMEKANSQYIHEFSLPGPVALSKQLLTYMTRIGYPKTLAVAHPGVFVYTPGAAALENAQVLNIDIIGEKVAVDGVVKQVSELIGKLIGATEEVTIDWVIHRIIIGKYAKKYVDHSFYIFDEVHPDFRRFKQYHDVHNVQVFFPPESVEQSSVLLVYDPLSPSASPSPVEKRQHLEDVSKDLLKLAKDAADVKSETIDVDVRWHEAVKGLGGTTLNA